ncbi:hypothetical protein GS461_19830 [Rhodococcus hoagii]|nr:hypothetical protein [Prescottella equi]
MARLDFDKLNSTLRYAMFSVFQVQPGVLGEDRAAAVKNAQDFFASYEDTETVVRGIYDVAGVRADADYMIWTHAERLEDLQKLYADFRRTTDLGQSSDPVWSNVALHRPADSTRAPSRRSSRARSRATTSACTPFVRSYGGTCCPTPTAGKMLADHGMAGRTYPDGPRKHDPGVRRSATTSGSSRSRLRSWTASSTSCATCARPRPACTCARRPRSSRVHASASSRLVNSLP